MSSMQPLILTVKIEKSAFEFFDRLRIQHFPPQRNFIPAHITLFHHLPGEREFLIKQTLREICSQTEIFSLDFSKPLFLGKGTAIEIASPQLVSLRQQLAAQFFDDLTAQDKQKPRPHITIQNKVTPDVARRLYNQFVSEWQPFTANAEGLLLWEYQNPSWRFVAEFDFVGANNR